MNIPFQNYLIIAVAIVLGVTVAVLLYRRKRGHRVIQNPYIEALKQLVDGDVESAFQKLQEAVRAGVAPTDAYIKLGNLLRERGEASKALQIHQSLTVKTNLPRAEKVELFLSVAEDHARMGSVDKGVKVLESAIRSLGIKDADVYLTLARYQHELGMHDKSYDTLKEAGKLGGVGERELALYMCTAAEALIDKDELKEAKKVLQRALKHDADCATCLYMLGNIAERSNDLDDAINHWKRVAVLSPQLAGTALHKLESTLYERGRFGDIEKIYNDVRATRGGDESANLGLAAFYKKQGRGEEAIELLEEYLTAKPESVPASWMLTSFYARYRDPETLQSFLDESVKKPRGANHFQCKSCLLTSEVMRWHCPRCSAFDSFSANHEA